MKYKIEKNTVQETLIIPLYARKVCSELYPNLYQDETAVRLIDEIDYDFSEAEKNSRSLMQRFGSLEVAMRQNDLAFEVRDYLKSHPSATSSVIMMLKPTAKKIAPPDASILENHAVSFRSHGIFSSRSPAGSSSLRTAITSGRSRL